MKKVLCFGELLLRFSPELNGEWIRQQSIPVFVGGAELNVATALAKWSLPVSYCTALPHNALSFDIINYIRNNQIEADQIILTGERIGSYYLPQGADLKNAGVIYDRAFSSFWNLKTGMINWDQVFHDVEWFHFSAITPALNDDLAMVCREALEYASKKQITISVDLNYRAKLWQYGKRPVDVMPALVEYCDLVMGNVWAAEKMLGIPVANVVDNKEDCLEQSEKTSVAIMGDYSKCKTVANTFRFEKGDGVKYYASIYDGAEQFVSIERSAASIVDKIGSGDTFMAGLIYGKRNGFSSQEIIDFAAAAAFNKLFIKGDATTATVEDIMKGFKNYA
jgi:2-dehydro-3-deoxygluconokinase